MNIGIDGRGINLYSGSGIGTYSKNLILNLINNFQDHFEIIWTGEENKKFIKDNTSLTCISGRYSSFYENFFIPNLMSSKDIDLYHLPQNGIGLPLNSNIKKFVVTIHDLIPYTMPETVGKGYLTRFLKEMPYIIESVSGILTVSQHSKNDILRFFPNFPSDKIYVTPLAANDNFKPLEKNTCKEKIKNLYNIDDPFILYLGGFSSRKNVRTLILAFKKVMKDLKKNYKLLLGGAIKDEGNILKELCISNGLENKVIFPGFIPDDLIPILYNAADVFVYPSYYEGFGLPPLEAMSCGTPVITSNLTSIPEVTEDTALLINPSNEEELCNALLKVLNNDNFKETLSKAGLKRSLDFSWKKTAELTYKAYSKIINS